MLSIKKKKTFFLLVTSHNNIIIISSISSIVFFILMCASLKFLKSSPPSVPRRHGLLGLYKGLEAKLLQTVLTAALMFVVYEKITAATFRLMGLQRKLKHWHTGAFIHDYLSNTPAGRAPHIPSSTAPLTWAHLGKVQSRLNTGQVKARKKALVFNILL